MKTKPPSGGFVCYYIEAFDKKHAGPDSRDYRGPLLTRLAY